MNQRLHSIKKFISKLNEYRIRIPAGKQFEGIKDTLIGWAIIGLSFLIKEDVSNAKLASLNFTIIYFSGAVSILLLTVFNGFLRGSIVNSLRGLCIVQHTDKDLRHAHISVKHRRTLIYLRGFIATSGWIAVNIASLSFSYIDNSAIFGADAFVFAILAVWFLDKSISVKEWAGIVIACFGIMFVLFFDLQPIQKEEGVICALAGLYSSIAFALIFFMTSIIVRHDTPLRIAFHTSLVGLSISLIVFLFLYSCQII